MSYIDELREQFRTQGRNIGRVDQPADDEALGPLKHLPGGIWKSEGRGWNMIALPFQGGPLKYRLLLNQYSETLKFNFVDKGVPNRGIGGSGDATGDPDQFLVALDYEQKVTQLRAEDFPKAPVPSFDDKGIHHEPGLWLHMIDERTNGVDIARLATVPHGDSVLALGTSRVVEPPPGAERVDANALIPDVSGLPIGVPDDLANPYLAPYKHFADNPFKGTVRRKDFPGFSPLHPNELLRRANKDAEIKKVTVLHVDTRVETGGIVNIPFIVKQANAAEMVSIFWVQELVGEDGQPKLRLQYSQVVLLDFFQRRDGMPGPIRWPHVSINTLEKVPDEEPEEKR